MQSYHVVAGNPAKTIKMRGFRYLSQMSSEEKKETHGLVGIFKPRLWIILGGGVFLLLLIQIGLKETFLALKSVNLFYLFASVVLIAIGQQFIPFLKWVVMCHKTGMHLETKEVLFVSASILIGGILTPGRTGEFITALLVKETKGRISSMVLFNRVIESSITLLVAIFVFGILFRNFLPSKSWVYIGITLGALLFFVYLVATKERFGIFILSKGKRSLIFMNRIKFFQKCLDLEDRITKEVGHFYQSMKDLFSWPAISILILFTFITWLTMTCANWSLFLSVGMEVPFKIIIAVMVLSAIGSFISPTPGGIGLGDIPPVYFLVVHGYQQNVGAFLLLGRVTVYVVAFAWYFLWTGIYHKRTLPKADVS